MEGHNQKRSLLRRSIDLLVDMSFVGLIATTGCFYALKQSPQQYKTPEPKVAVVEPVKKQPYVPVEQEPLPEPVKGQEYTPLPPEPLPEPVKGQEYTRLPTTPEEQARIKMEMWRELGYPEPFIKNGIPATKLVIVGGR